MGWRSCRVSRWPAAVVRLRSAHRRADSQTHNHILNFVITTAATPISNVRVGVVISDHALIHFTLHINRPASEAQKVNRTASVMGRFRPIWLCQNCVVTWVNATTCPSTTWSSCTTTCWSSCWTSIYRVWRCIAGASKQCSGSTPTLVLLYIIRGLQRDVRGGRVPMPTSHSGQGT